MTGVRRLSAFADGLQGGNPAGIVIADALPDPARMQAIAAEVGYSETVFAAPEGDGWRVRYFAPEGEVAFCGHATIALGAALSEDHGPGRFALQLNEAAITVEADKAGLITLQSPPTHSAPAQAGLVSAALDLFGLRVSDLDPALPPTRAHAGADHLVIGLNDRNRLAAMHYDLDAGRTLMRGSGLTTIALVVAGGPRVFHVRNAFAAGGVLEDPATGAAAAALAGMLRDLGWPHGNSFAIRQGDDMGRPSRITVRLTDTPGAPVWVSGRVAPI